MNFAAPPVGSQPAVRALRKQQLGEVIELLAEASAWAGARGSLEWTGAELDPAVFLKSADRGELFGLVFDDRVIGCMLIQEEDRTHWPDSTSGEALYVHKLAVRRSHAGRGMGERLVAFACRTAMSRGMAAVRLDTTPMSGLERYYGRLGFVADPGGPADFGGRWLIRMEKRL